MTPKEQASLARTTLVAGDAGLSGRVADAAVPLYITATDFHTGEQVVLSRGSVADAVRAVPVPLPDQRVPAAP